MDNRLLYPPHRLCRGRDKHARVLAAVIAPRGYPNPSRTYSNASFRAASYRGNTRHHKSWRGVLAKRLFESDLGHGAATCCGTLWGSERHYGKQASGRKVEEERGKISLSLREQPASYVDL